MAYDCLSVGVLVADHLCTPIDHLPAAGELVLAQELPLAIGGCAANAAIDLARLGVHVGVAGCVGDDAFGRFIAETLASQGVASEALRRLPDCATSGTLIINVAGQDRRFIHALGANAAFRVEQIDVQLAGRVLYVGGYLLMPAFDPQQLAQLFRQVRRRGVQTVLDVVLPGPGDHWASLAPVLAETDVFLPNEDEARAITGLTDPLAQAERFRQAGARVVVITCGAAGSLLVAEGLRLRTDIFPVDFVGGTGAGDAFDAGYIAGLLAGCDPRECVRWGSALGASCVRSISATQSVFSRAELEQFLAQRPFRFTAV